MTRQDRRNRSGKSADQHRATAASNRERHRLGPYAAARAEPEFAVVLGRCPDCGEPIEWLRQEELEQRDPAALDALLLKFGAEQVLAAETWLCPGCGSSGIITDEEPAGPEPDPETYDTVSSAEQDLAEDYQGELDTCETCGAPVDWLDPAQVAAIDKASYMQAKKEHGAAALLAGEVEVCRGCGQIIFYPV